MLDGRYELVERVGTGGMGVVWRVFDAEWGRDLALKLPLPAVLESPVLRERYLREAETWIGLGVHPHIVQCWFVTEIEGVPALFLDYLTGGSLADWMDEGHIEPGQWELIIEIAMQAAEGLAYAHSKGVIHRDVKPENLLIRGDERVCVTDFGLVKTAVEESEVLPSGLLESSSGVTCVGAFLGTPRYAAPEQWGAAELVGPPADIYALGVTLYEMCAGRRPFDHDDEDIPPMDLVRRHLSLPPPDPRDFEPSVPAELAELCLRMLDKDPGKRPPQMGAVREALQLVHRKLSGRNFRPAAPLLETQTSDVLNNQAVSLHSLGKVAEAEEALRRGLDLDPGHPECLYNLVQLQRRSGRIGHLEALRRLKQARAYYPLSLLSLEQGKAEEALLALQEVQPHELSSAGLHHRARGDALMVLGDYVAAGQAYAEAELAMPKDTAIALRRRLASAGRGRLPGGAIHFPSAKPLPVGGKIDPLAHLKLDVHASAVIEVTQTSVVSRSLREGDAEIWVARCPSAGRVSRIWIAEDRLAIADSRGFEIRELPSMQLLGRREGRLLACTPRVDYMIVLEGSSPSLVVLETGEFQHIDTGGQKPGDGPFLAAFDRQGQALILLLPSGNLATLDEYNRAIVESWPSRVDGHQEVSCLAVTADRVVVVGLANGTIRGYNLNTRTVDFATQVDDVPRTLEVCSGGTRLIVRTARDGFFILSRGGQVLLSGDGALAVEPQGQRALVAYQGRLVLLNLNPLHEVREWPQREVSPLQSAGFSADGRLAVTLSISGSCSVWEVDETNRVYQRELLMSPGRSYADILSADEQFHRHMSLAREALARREFSESQRHWRRARKVPGYGQRAVALDFGWQLLQKLKRHELEAVWERLSIEEASPFTMDLHPKGRRLLFCHGQEARLALDQDGSVRTMWTASRPDPIMLARFVQSGEESLVLTVDASGQAALHNPADGSLDEFSLDGAPLAQVALHGSLLTFQGRNGGLGQYDLADGSYYFREEALPLQLIVPWRKGKVLATTSESLGILDLAKPGSALEPLRLGLAITKVPCFMENLLERGLLVLGFTSGTLRILDVKGSGVLAALPHGEGNIVTSFQLLAELSVAVTTTARGQICFWDLLTQQSLEEFVVHQNGVAQARASQSGRYLLTSECVGTLRYWETSWTTGELRGKGKEVSWPFRRKSGGLFTSG